MRPALLPTGIALAGLCVIGLTAGDPRATRDLGLSSEICLAGLGLSVAVGLSAWWAGRRRSWVLIVPAVMLAILGGLSGWIAGAEFTLQPDTAIHLGTAPGRVAFMIAFTTVGMALPAVLLIAIAAWIRRPGRART